MSTFIFSSCVSICVVFGCVVFRSLSQYFKAREPTFLYYCPDLVSESLVCCLKSCEFNPNFYLSFSIHSLCGVCPKITVQCNFIILPSSFFVHLSLIWEVNLFIIYVTEKKNSQGCRFGHPCWLLREHLPIITPKPAVLVPPWVLFWSVILHGWYIVAILDPGVVYYLCTWDRCDQFPLSESDYWRCWNLFCERISRLGFLFF